MKSEFLEVKEYIRCWKRLKSIECKAFSWDSCRILCKATVRILQIVHLLRIERWLQQGGFCQRWAECTQLRSSSNAEASKFPPPPRSLSLLPCASPSSSSSHPQHCLLLTMTLYCFPNSVRELDVEFWILSRSSRKVKVRACKERSVVSIHLGFDWQPLSRRSLDSYFMSCVFTRLRPHPSSAQTRPWNSLLSSDLQTVHWRLKFWSHPNVMVLCGSWYLFSMYPRWYLQEHLWLFHR